MKIEIYTDNEKYNMHCAEYKAIWEIEGPKITDSFVKFVNISFKEKEISLLINEGKNGGNFCGLSSTDEMIFRNNNRCKIGTFLHELSDRIVLEYNLLKTAEKYGFKNIHEIVDLFLYDVITDLYGEQAAKNRVEYESDFDDPEYKDAWKYALALSYEERQKVLSKIIDEVI